MWLLALIVVGVAWYFQYYMKNRDFWKKIQAIPGPNPMPILGNALEITNDPVTIYKVLYRYWQEHNMKTFKILITNQPLVLLSTPDAVETLLSSSKLIDKHLMYKFLDPWLGNGLLTSTGSLWHARRKIITPAFHFKILEEFVDVFNRTATILIEKFNQLEEGVDINIHPYVNKASLDAICESAMGYCINAQNSECEYADAVANACWFLHKRMVSPFLIFEPIFKLSHAGKEFFKSVNVMHKQVNEVIATRRKDMKKVEDAAQASSEIGMKRKMAFLDLLMVSKDSEGNALTDDDLRDEIHTFMFEGHDTLTCGVSFALLNLSRNPHIQDKIIEEQKAILGEKYETPVTLREANDMKYLERVIKESMRLNPPVPMYGRHITEDVTLQDGTELPKGTNVTITTYMMHRNPKLFPKPDTFDPDRFLPENLKGSNPYSYVPFSAGPRNCIGQKYALLEMKCVLSKILQNFKFEESPNFEPALTADLVLKSNNGVKIRLRKRV